MNNENPLGYEKTGTLLRKFAVPSIVAMLVNSLYNIVDQIFIGQGVGFLGNAATNVAFPFNTICLAISLLVGIGAASKFSLELGRGNEEEAQNSVGLAIDSVVFFGLILFLIVKIFLNPMLKAFGATENIFPYAKSYVSIINYGLPLMMFTTSFSALIRADGSPKYSMGCNIVGAVVNTILDPIFIFVLKMGVAGAALATIISQFLSFCFALSYLWRFKRIKLSKHMFRPDILKAVKIWSLGLSNCINQVALTFVHVVINNSLVYWGAQSIYGSDIPLSAAGVVMKANGIIISIFIGISQGSQPIIGFNYGAKEFDRVKAVYKQALTSVFIIGLIATIMFQLFPAQILSLFGSSNDESIRTLYMDFAVRYCRIFLALEAIIGIQMISSNFFAAIGKPLKGAILALSRQFFCLTPLVLILPHFMGIYGIMFAAPLSDFVSSIITFLMINHEFKNISKLNSN